MDSPLSTATIGAVLGDRLAIVFCQQNLRWTWAQFKSEVDRFAAWLASLGLLRGERLGVQKATPKDLLGSGRTWAVRT